MSNVTESDEYSVKTIDTVIDFVNLAEIVLGCSIQIILCCGLLLFLLLKIRNPFNALWLARITMILSVITINVGVIFGNAKAYDGLYWFFSGKSIDSSLSDELFKWFCRVYYIGDVSGQVALTTTVAWVIFHSYKFKKKGLLFESKPFKVVSVFKTNCKVIWKTLLVTIIVVILMIVLFGIEYIVGIFVDPESIRVVGWIYTAYDTKERKCRNPGVAAAAYLVYMIAFLILYNYSGYRVIRRTICRSFRKRLIWIQLIISIGVVVGLIFRAIEVASYIIGEWNLVALYVDRFSRIIIHLCDITMCFLFLTFYVLWPLLDTIDSSKWNKSVHEETGSYGYASFKQRVRQRAASFAVGKSDIYEGDEDEELEEVGKKDKALDVPGVNNVRRTRRRRRVRRVRPPPRTSQSASQGRTRDDSSEEEKENEENEKSASASEEEEDEEDEDEESDAKKDSDEEDEKKSDSSEESD